MTSPVYRYLKDGNPQVYKTDGVGPINLGDLVIFDVSADKVVSMPAAADFAEFFGVAEGNIPPTSNVDNVSGLETGMRVRHSGIFLMLATAGETYSHGDELKLGANAQTVMLDGGAAQVIGYVNLPLGGSVVAVAGTQIEVQIRPNFPSSTLASR